MKHNVSKKFREAYVALSPSIRRLARKQYKLMRADLHHPSVHFEKLRTKSACYSARVNQEYRALGYPDTLDGEEVIIWFWIGHHSTYEKLIARL